MNGFQEVQDQLDEIKSVQRGHGEILAQHSEILAQHTKTLEQHSVVLDNLAQGVDLLKTEAGAQTLFNQRVNERFVRLETHVGLEPLAA